MTSCHVGSDLEELPAPDLDTSPGAAPLSSAQGRWLRSLQRSGAARAGGLSHVRSVPPTCAPGQVRALNDDVRQRGWLLAYVVASLPSGLGVRVHVGEAEEVDDGVHLRAVGERHALAGIPTLRE